MNSSESISADVQSINSEVLYLHVEDLGQFPNVIDCQMKLPLDVSMVVLLIMLVIILYRQ